MVPPDFVGPPEVGDGRSGGRGGYDFLYNKETAFFSFYPKLSPILSHSEKERHLWGGDRRGGGVLDIIHGRSGVTIDLRIPTLPGRSMSGFRRPGRTFLAPSANRREVPGETHGKGELRLTKNRL